MGVKKLNYLGQFTPGLKMSIPTTRPLAQVTVTDEEKSEWKDHFSAVRKDFLNFFYADLFKPGVNRPK